MTSALLQVALATITAPFKNWGNFAKEQAELGYEVPSFLFILEKFFFFRYFEHEYVKYSYLQLLHMTMFHVRSYNACLL